MAKLLLAAADFALNNADRIFAVSPRFLEDYPQHAAKTAIIPDVMPMLDKYSTLTINRDPPPVPLNRPLRGLFVGRLHPQKAVDVLLKALTAVPNMSCEIVGDGDLHEPLEHQMRSLDLADRVRFWGHLPEDKVFELMTQADVLLLASRTEDTPNVLIEASALGLPAIVSYADGMKYMLKDGETGLFCQPGDVESLRQCLIDFMHRPDQWLGWGAKAKAFVYQTYGTAVIKQRAEAFLQQWVRDDKSLQGK